MSTFSQSLNIGKVGESVIASLLRASGFSVLPVYEIEKSEGKGPRLFAPSEQIVAPDMFAYRGAEAAWIEAKHKNAFSWHRASQRFTTGIDLHHYFNYCKIADRSPWPVWLLFLHRGGVAKDSPESPAGLYGGNLADLRHRENHRHHNHGPHGMVYWAESTLTRFCDVPRIGVKPSPVASFEAIQSKDRTVALERQIDEMYASLAVLLGQVWQASKGAIQ